MHFTEGAVVIRWRPPHWLLSMAARSVSRDGNPNGHYSWHQELPCWAPTALRLGSECIRIARGFDVQACSLPKEGRGPRFWFDDHL
jgi:hypothetical protein